MGRLSHLESVDPLPGLAPWIGGKSKLAAELSRRIERIPHTCYAEPFVGLGAAFFGRHKRPRVEVVNDINGDVVNLFRIVRHHPHALLSEMRGVPRARAEFERLLLTDPAILTDVQRAARFIFLQRSRYRGMPDSRSFLTSATDKKTLSPAAHRRRVFSAAARLSTVTIERLPYDEFISRYDAPTTLFYLDPPYYGCETYYGPAIFGRADFERLADQLSDIKGRFLLSINDRPETRRLFRRCRISTVKTSYSRARMEQLPVTELIITGGGPAK